MSRLHLPTALAVLLLALPGCKLLDRSKDKSDESAVTEPNAATPASKAADKKGAGEGCALPANGRLDEDFTVKAGCSVEVKTHLFVRDGATLTIEEGATLAFEPGRYLQVDKGKLVAHGTEQKPVVLTSAASTKAAGDWVGIVFEDGTTAGTELEWVTLEYAGADKSGGKGALTMRQRSPQRVSVRHTTIRHSELAAVGSESEKATFGAFEDNTLDKNKLSVRAPLEVLGSIGKGNSFGDPLATWGDLDESVTLPQVTVPILVERNIDVGGRSSAPTLTIPAKTMMKFSGGRYLSVGSRSGGSLNAPGVVFTSANDSPQPGDWAGIILEKRATNVDLTGATVEYAGKGAGARAAITVRAKASDIGGLKASGMTFKGSAEAAVATQDKDCAPFAQGSTSAGAPLCRTN
mgnify:CR=1 FL=1